MDAVVVVHKKMVSSNCNQYLEAAKTAWLNYDLETARRNLVLIESGSQCYDSGVELSTKINAELANGVEIAGEGNGGAIEMRVPGEQAPKDVVVTSAKAVAVKNVKQEEYTVDFIK